MIQLLLACTPPTTRPDPEPTPSLGYAYDVPLAPDSPWPRFRRTSAQDGRGAFPTTGGGGEPWTFATSKGIFSSPVIGGDGTVYLGSADRSFYALAPDGTERWRFETGEIIDSAALLDDRGRVYFGSGDGHVYALEAETGELVWSFEADDPAENRAFIHWFEGNVAMAPNGDLLAPNDNFFVYALDRDDGSVRWRFTMADQTWSAPAVDAKENVAYIGNNNLLPVGANTYAIDLGTGEERWSRLDAKGSVAASPLLHDDGVVLGGFDGFVRSHDPATGALLWDTGVRDHVYASAGRLSDGTVVVPGADGTVWALDPATGNVRWAFDTPEPIRSSPAIGADDSVVFGGGDGRLYVLEGDGTLRWSMRLVDGDRNDLNASPALGDGFIVIAGESGEIFGVPYDWCLTADDERCETGGEALPDDGTYLWPTTRWGTTTEAPAALGPAEPVALSLFSRAAGDTVLALLDDVEVTATPAVPLQVDVSADRRFVVVSPPATGWGTDRVTLRVRGGTVVDPERAGLAFGDGRPGDAVNTSLSFDVEPGELAAVAVGDTWELWRLAAPLPTILPSYNQIGFDSLHYRFTVVETDGATGVGWVEGALPGGEPDPATRTVFPVRLTVADGGLHLDADGGMTLEAMGAVLAFSDFRVTAPLDQGGSAPHGATLAVSAVCGDIPLYGSFLRTLGFCHPASDELHVYGGALLDARPRTEVGGIVDVVWAYDGEQIRADVRDLDAAHKWSILALDGAGPVALEYGTDTAVAGEVVTLAAPDLLPGARLLLLADGVKVAETTLE